MNEWISVKDRLPKYSVDVLSYDTACGIDVVTFINGMFYYDGCAMQHVTHWMPMPKPPKDSK